MIGITLPASTFKHEVKHLNDEDSILNQYTPLAKKYQADLCMFSFKHIQPNLMVEALVYSYREDISLQKMAPVPRINIVRNTSYVVDQGLISKFERLRSQDIHFINFPIFWQAHKLQNYEYLNSLDPLKRHVPTTKPLSLEQLNSLIRQYGKVIIKPIYGSKGRGITIIEKDPVGYQVSQTSSGRYADSHRGSNQKRLSIPYTQMNMFYNDTFHRPASFLVQQWLPFKELNGLPFDIRAVVQKNGKNRWQLTSRVARVANGKGQITNLNQGGEMVSFSDLHLKEYHRDIRKFSLKIAKAFARLYPWTAEMGIDLAIDQKGKLWYIETNFCPEKTRWPTIFKIPFEYAYYLWDRGTGTLSHFS